METPTTDPGASRPEGLADVTGISLTDLQGLQDSALARAMRRIFDEIDRSQGAIAGWQSAI